MSAGFGGPSAWAGTRGVSRGCQRVCCAYGWILCMVGSLLCSHQASKGLSQQLLLMLSSAEAAAHDGEDGAPAFC